MVYRILVLILLSAFPAMGQEDHTIHTPNTPRVNQSFPQGYYGVGHDKWHHLYKNMHNVNGGSCCTDAANGECRPTTSKVIDGKRYALVDGHWMEINPNRFVKEYKFSFSDTAHICAKGTSIYCFIPEGPGI